MSDQAATPPESKANPDDATELEAPAFEPKKGGRVLFCYMRNGPLFRHAAAVITKVHAKRAGEDGPRLDLKVAMPTPQGTADLEPVVERDVPACTGPEQARTWAPPMAAKPAK